MKVLLDTNIVIDVIAKREPYFKDSYNVFKLIAMKTICGFITSKQVTDIYYIIKKTLHDEKRTRESIIKIVSLLDMVDTLSIDVKSAFDTKLQDYEDGLLETIAYRKKLNAIVTRNIKDFKNSIVKIIKPNELA